MTTVNVERQRLIEAYNQATRTQLAVNAAVRTAENAARTLTEAQAQAALATDHLVLILQEMP